MRSLLAGLIFLCLLPALAGAQVSGTVESIGFDGYFRPECWTPMVVTVTPETGKTDFYQIHVKVQDLDRDLPIYQRTISVTGAAEGNNRLQTFRMYFIPPPTDNGLPDASDPGSLRNLQDRLKVSLHTNSGKWICDLPLTGTVRNLDPVRQWGTRRGTKLVLAVSDGRSRPIYPDATEDLQGVMEDVKMVTVHPRELPENVLGYDAVDAVVWLDADPSQIKGAEDEQYRALESYIRRGGKLVVCQSLEWQKTLALSDLLPVTVTAVESRNELSPLRRMAQPRSISELPLAEQMDPTLTDPFAELKPPFQFARATAKPSAIVDPNQIWWEAHDDFSPYIVRMPLGLGSVTWVAQDLGDVSLTRTRRGWANVWDRVFDWNNQPLLVNANTSQEAKGPFDSGHSLDLGGSLLAGMDLQSKSAWLITLAVLFFIGYWLIAGPGTYTYLASRRKAHLSWFMFGACALGATAFTALIVKLVLRGPPELRHFSIVRVAPNQPAVVISRFGLYIPRDGWQQIQLAGAEPDAVTSISAWPVSPAFLKNVTDQPGSEYTVPLVDPASRRTAELSFKYRSTLKKFEATWIGKIDGAIQGSVKLAPQVGLAGLLTNATSQRLKNVYVAFNYPPGDTLQGDWILYLPVWDPAVTLDMTRMFNTTETGDRLMMGLQDFDGTHRARGRLLREWWESYWLADLERRAGPMSDVYDDSGSGLPKSLVILSLFDRLQPAKNDRLRNQWQRNRVDLLRRGGRTLDLSHSIAAGAMVVLAEAEGPLPIPLNVEGSPVTGQGTIFYQFVLPLDRTAATTQPTTEPTTRVSGPS